MAHLFARGSRLDLRITLFTTQHINLIMAIAILCLAVWGGCTGHQAFVFGLAIVGASAYFAGILISVSVAIVYLSVNLCIGWTHPVQSSVILLQLIGYLAVAFLGYKHKTFKEKQKTINKPHQVLPWAMVNEVRTSLSAIRFLLFPLQNRDAANPELQKATDELSRLEQLFQELEEKGEKRHE